MDHFLCLAKKVMKIIDQLVWVFCKMHHLITFFFGLHLSLWQFQMSRHCEGLICENVRNN